MAYEQSVEEKILAALARIERKLDRLDEIDRHVKAAEQEIHRVKVEARNRGYVFRLPHHTPSGRVASGP